MSNKCFATLRWITLALVLALIPKQAHACSCVLPAPPTEALAEATGVFAGRVTNINYPLSSGSSADPVQIVFNVSQVWKGPAFRILTVETPLSGASCGYGFQADQEYLIYAGGEEEHLQVSLCSRTKLLSNATEDLAALGEGTIPAGRTSYLPTLHSPPCEQNLVGTLEENSGFSMLLQALEAANLTTVLETAGPFTMFAPTDAAFAGLPVGVLDQLLENPTGQLMQMLLYHIVPGYIELQDLENGMQLTTQQGKSITVERDCHITLNGARLVTPNLRASNGVIHAIDVVLLPPPD